MSAVVDKKTPVNIKSILLENKLKSAAFKVVDMTADSYYLDRNLDFEDQAGSIVLELNLIPNIREIVKRKIFSYSLKFVNPTTNKFVSSHIVSFYEDFKNIINIGESDYQAIINEMLKPQTMIIDTSLDPDGTVGQGSSFTLYDTESDSPLTYAASSASLMESGLDPDDTAQMAMAKFPVSSTAYSLDGTGTSTVSEFRSKKHKSFMTRYIGDRISLLDLRAERLKTIVPKVDNPVYLKHEGIAQSLASAEISYDSSSSSGETIDVGRQITFVSEYFNSKRMIEIPKLSLEGGVVDAIFEPIITGLDGDDNPSDTSVLEAYEIKKSVIRIKLPERIPNLIEPEVPPEVIIRSNTPGKISYSVKRNDPTTNKIVVTIRHINKHTMKPIGLTSDKEVEYSFVGYENNIKHGVATGCVNKDPYIVQIVAQDIGRDGTGLSSTTAIALSHPSETLQDYKTNFVSINAFLKPKGRVRVEVDQEPVQLASKIRLYRENLTVSTSSTSRNKMIAKFTSPDMNFSFTDETATPGTTYRYYAISEYSKSSHATITANESVVSTCDSIIKVLKENKNIYNISLNSPSPRSFKGSVLISKNQASLIDSQLKESDINLENFKSLEAVSTHQSLKKLLYFIVERLDRDTGIREFMTIVQPGELYTDENPSLDKRYTYIFRLCAANATAAFVLENIVKSKDTVDSSEVNSYVSMLNENLSQLSGVMESADTFFAKTDKFSAIKAGVTSQEKAYTVVPHFNIEAPKMNTPHEIREGYRGASPSIKIRWTVSDKADIGKIDCFYVWCRYQGQETVIQTVNCSNSVTKYSYVDTEYFNEIGQKTYYVVARYKDYVFGPPSQSITRSKFAPVSIPMLQNIQLLPIKKIFNPKPVYMNSLLTSISSNTGFFEG